MTRQDDRSRFALLLLAASIFVIGTSELLPTGLLLELTRDFDVSVRAAGWVVTAYALAVVIGGPILALATARLPARPLLVSLLALFAAGSLLSFAAPSFAALLVSRVVCALAQGAFFGASVALASRLAPPGREGASIALAASGLTVATVLGNPLGTLIGQQAGWRLPFLLLAALAVLAAAGIRLAVPRLAGEEAPAVVRQLREVSRAGLLLALLTTVFGSGGTFLVLTYIAPLLERKSGLPEWSLSYVLILFGVASFFGNYLGGRWADKRLAGTLFGGLAGLIAVMLLFSLTVRSAVPAVATVFLWGLLAYAIIAPLNMWALRKAGPAQGLASTLNISAFNLGNALGAYIGGRIADGRLGLEGLPWASALMALIGLGFAAWGLAGRRMSAGERAAG